MSVFWLSDNASEQVTFIDKLLYSLHPFEDEKRILRDIRQNLTTYWYLKDIEREYLENMVVKYGYLLD
jgi:hypothetical protein